MNQTSKLLGLALAGGILLGAAGARIRHQAQPQDQASPPARSRADETLEWWNHIGNKLVAMAKDFAEDKDDFKVQKDQRTSAENLLHVAAVDYDIISRVPDQMSGRTSEMTSTIPRAMFTRARPTWSSYSSLPSPRVRP
jgi:hypothetical protein